MRSRRRFLTTATFGVAGLASLTDDAIARVAAATRSVADRSPEEIAKDESFWREIQLGFAVDRSITNLNNGGVCPSPRVVHEAFKRYLDVSNQSPVYHMWQVLEPNKETVRRRLAANIGVDTEELALTRNASEALQIAQLGLDLAPGDEVLTTTQDYGRMLDTWEQRVARDKIVLKKIQFPVPPPSLADLAARIEQAITPKTKVIHFCHITNLTGQIFPVRDICRLARARGITTIVDGAHAYAQFPFKVSDFECDFYGTSLHKWLLAPVGTGFLYVRRDRIAGHWALTPAGSTLKGEHPQVRGGRHASGRESSRDCRGVPVPRHDRRGTEGGAPALSAPALGGSRARRTRARSISPATIRRRPARSARWASRASIR